MAKVTTVKPEFPPVTIVLEQREELEQLVEVLSYWSGTSVLYGLYIQLDDILQKV